MPAPEQSNPNTAKTKVIAFVRVSTASQATDDRAGIDGQLSFIDQAVKRNNLEVVKTVKLVLSGTKVRTHPEFIWMQQQVEARHVSGVVIAALDRLCRPNEFADYGILDPFVKAGAKIWTSSAVHDLSVPMQRFAVMLHLGFAGVDRSNILDRAETARETLREKGAHVWGKHQLPLGISYDRKTQTYSLTPKIGKIQEAFRLIDEEGVTNIREVARRLDIGERTLHRQLRNKLYAGLKVYELTRAKELTVSKRGKRYQAKVPMPPEKRHEVRVLTPSPVPLDRWERVQAILYSKGKSWRDRRVEHSGNFIRGIAFCGCGAPLYLSPNSRTPGHGYFYCSKNYYRNRSKSGGCGRTNQRQTELNLITLDFASEILSKPEATKALIQHGVTTQISTNLEPLPGPGAPEESTDWAGRDTRIKRLFELGKTTEAEMNARLDQLTLEKAAFEARLVAKDEARAAAATDSFINGTAANIVRGARAFRRITDPNWRQRALSGLFQEIHYENHQIAAFKLRAEIFPADVCENGIRVEQATSLTASLSGRAGSRCSTVSVIRVS